MSADREVAPGAPVRHDGIPLSVPDVGPAEKALVAEALDAGWVSSAGPYLGHFEEDVAAACEVGYAVACASGTAALHVALIVAGVQPGDLVLTSSLSFIAPANAIRYCGAEPVFFDAEPEHWQIDPERLAAWLQERCTPGPSGKPVDRRSGRRIGALLPVHILGHPFDADPIVELARRYELPLVEDAAEGLGARYKGRPLGGFGDVAALSFNGNKMVTSGGGGMLLTDDGPMAERAWYLTTTAKDDPVEYVHGEVGFNYRLTSLQAALGTAQLRRLGELVARKQAIAARYREGLAGVGAVSFMTDAPWAANSWWMPTILVRGGSRTLLRTLAADGIQTRPIWQPLHRSPAHRGAEVVGGGVAERLSDGSLSLPCSPSLTEADQDRVIAAVRAAL
jgi:perosamine synthetase